ncbi:hypothetical protein RQP46_006154 [Phenoliferia psychrophenolica]
MRESEEREINVLLEPGKAWEYSAILRVGDEKRVAASTVPDGPNRIAVSHKITIELQYRAIGTGKVRMLGIVLPAKIDDCLALPGSLLLPEYTPQPPHIRTKRTKEHTICLCEFGTRELMDAYREALEAGAPLPLELVTDIIEATVELLIEEEGQLEAHAPLSNRFLLSAALVDRTWNSIAGKGLLKRGMVTSRSVVGFLAQVKAHGMEATLESVRFGEATGGVKEEDAANEDTAFDLLVESLSGLTNIELVDSGSHFKTALPSGRVVTPTAATVFSYPHLEHISSHLIPASFLLVLGTHPRLTSLEILPDPPGLHKFDTELTVFAPVLLLLLKHLPVLATLKTPACWASDESSTMAPPRIPPELVADIIELTVELLIEEERHLEAHAPLTNRFLLSAALVDHDWHSIAVEVLLKRGIVTSESVFGFLRQVFAHGMGDTLESVRFGEASGGVTNENAAWEDTAFDFLVGTLSGLISIELLESGSWFQTALPPGRTINEVHLVNYTFLRTGFVAKFKDIPPTHLRITETREMPAHDLQDNDFNPATSVFLHSEVFLHLQNIKVTVGNTSRNFADTTLLELVHTLPVLAKLKVPARWASDALREALKRQTLLAPLFTPLLPESYLPALNENQRKAVEHSHDGGLQILAGPGSGKTKVLTTRVAYLIQHYKIEPENIIVVTFTNKAANEMKERLKVLVGPVVVDRLVMGTFHSVCVRYLRRHSSLAGLESNFVITDRDDCLKTLQRLLKATPGPIAKDLKHTTVCDVISKCKSQNQSPQAYRLSLEAVTDPNARNRMDVLADLYEQYQEELASANAVDFDDLLLLGLKLVQKNPKIMSKIRTVLIDEFQDTNNVQFALVKAMAKAQGSLTIVGDPDQSIYGWRFAEVENLDRMSRDFKPVTQIFLEQNYRSTGAILGAALAVVSQDTKRIKKSLKATHATGLSVVLHQAQNAPDEADFVARQIRHVVAHSGGLVDYGDVAVLLRYGALSRNIEVALQKAGIPSRMVGGHKFFERAEVKDMLSYLQLIDCPTYTPAFARVVNTPKRGIGEKTVRDILALAKLKKLTAFEVCVRIANGGGMTGVTTAQRKALKQFVKVILELRKEAEEGRSVPDLIESIVRRTAYLAHLERTYGSDLKERTENIKELQAYATTVDNEHPEGLTAREDGEVEMEEVVIPRDNDDASGAMGFPGPSQDEIEVEDDEDEVLVMPVSSQAPEEASNPLRTFLAVSMLATDTETETEDDAKARKVTLSTCHAAKGLEWPIVFVPACEDGTYPFFRSTESNEVDEERRLLYVAITRAKILCTLSYSKVRMAGAETKEKLLSPFLVQPSTSYPTLFVPKLQTIGVKARRELAQVLGRPVPDETQTSIMIDEHTASLPPERPAYDNQPGSSQGGSYGNFSNGRFSSNVGSQQSGSSQWSQSQSQGSRAPGPAPIPAGAGFQSALKTYKNPGARPLASTSRILSFSRPRASLPATASSQPLSQMPETRASLINDAVLLNPVYKPPLDLLATFQANAAETIAQIKSAGSPEKDKDVVAGKGKGKAIVTIDLVESSPAPPEKEAVQEAQEESGGRPKRGAAKRAAEGFPKKPAPGKKARKTM